MNLPSHESRVTSLEWCGRATRDSRLATRDSRILAARTLMVQGTASGVGKSLLSAAFCRIFARRGLRVRPFKAQNMSNNAAVTPDGAEIGRAQEVQARAARVTPDARMNPVLLKPLADTRSDVVLLGRSRPELARLRWHQRHGALWPVVAQALDSLRDEADLVVIEGAGSPAETNLRASDIVNMAVAQYAASPVLLVADIDRGGAFASLFGTWSLLDDADRSRIRGFILNRFRGDVSLLTPAPDDLAHRTGVPVLGVVPYVRHALPEEDATGLASAGRGTTVIAAVRFPHIANFDDLDPLAAEPGIHVRWTDSPDGLADVAAIVLPGTRNTLGDLRWLWRTGIATAVRARAAAATPVLGICGGYQMLGHRVDDPHHIEAGGSCDGLGLLDVATTLEPEKATRWTDAQVRASAPRLPLAAGTTVRGYEIRHGATRLGPEATAWLSRDGDVVGVLSGDADRLVLGTSLHALFTAPRFRVAFLARLGQHASARDWDARIDRELECVADTVEQSVDIAAIERIIARDARCA